MPGETVHLTGHVNNSDNGADYDSCSSVEEEEIDDDESQSVATLGYRSKLSSWEGVCIWSCRSV